MTIDETQHDLLSSEEIKTLKVARTIAGHIFCYVLHLRIST